ncbi:MAG: molybdopterin dinucleotide binding domain-containing protein, partial [bacterium]
SYLYHFGSGARTKRSERLSEISPECFLEISPEDARQLQIMDGQDIRVISKTDSIVLPARITVGLPPKTLFVPVSLSAAEVNSLFSTEMDVMTGIPNKKMCVVRIEKM